MKRKINGVFVLVDPREPAEVLGYYTLYLTGLAQGDEPVAARKHIPRYPLVSATLMDPLAVAGHQQRQGLDALLLADAVKRAYASASSIGSSMLIVDAISELAAAFNHLEQTDSKVISADLWDKLCRQGARGGHPAKAEERWSYQDSRGLARALTGKSHGDIKDFEDVIQKTGYENLKKQRQAWVQALRAGLNPFTKVELATVQNQ